MSHESVEWLRRYADQIEKVERAFPDIVVPEAGDVPRRLREAADALAEVTAERDRKDKVFRSIMFAAQGTAEFDWVMDKCMEGLGHPPDGEET